MTDDIDPTCEAYIISGSASRLQAQQIINDTIRRLDVTQEINRHFSPREHIADQITKHTKNAERLKHEAEELTNAAAEHERRAAEWQKVYDREANASTHTVTVNFEADTTKLDAAIEAIERARMCSCKYTDACSDYTKRQKGTGDD